jgi:hypothetical protein
MWDEQTMADLDLLDHLELLNSTVKVGELLGLSQSSCSRRYRAFSEAIDLDFDRVDGAYAPQRNLDVLAALREAAQKLRVRRSQLRVHAGWQISPISWPERWRPLPLTTMSTAEVLSRLDGRLLDLWLGGIFECQPLLPAALEVLGPQRLSLGQSLLCVPLLRWKPVVVAHRRHPLVGRSHLSPDDFAAFPSPALPMGAAPLLNRQLQKHGLATTPYGPSTYDPERWEGAARDGHSLAYAPPHRLRLLEQQFELVPLPYDLGITEVAAVVGHRDVLADPSFGAAFRTLTELLQASPLAGCPGIQWLI